MTAKNDITGDKIKSKPTDDKYRENFDKIFGKKNKDLEQDSSKSLKTKYKKSNNIL